MVWPFKALTTKRGWKCVSQTERRFQMLYNLVLWGNFQFKLILSSSHLLSSPHALTPGAMGQFPLAGLHGFCGSWTTGTWCRRKHLSKFLLNLVCLVIGEGGGVQLSPLCPSLEGFRSPCPRDHGPQTLRMNGNWIWSLCNPTTIRKQKKKGWSFCDI